MSEWIEWKGGACPVDPALEIEAKFRAGHSRKAQAGLWEVCWLNADDPDDIVAYRIVGADDRAAVSPLTGGKLSGSHYYRIEVPKPISPELQPYSAECADIIEALGMTFNEGEAFKAIWRLAAARQGRGKPGNQPQYDADKAEHYGARIAAQTRARG